MDMLLFIALSLVFLYSLLLYSAVHSLPFKELKRRAKSSSFKSASRIYKLASFHRSSDGLLWFMSGLAAAGLVLNAAVYGLLFAATVALALFWLWDLSRQSLTYGSRLWQIADKLAPSGVWLVSRLHPILKKLPTPKINQRLHLFESEDLLETVSWHVKHAQSRLSHKELKTLTAILALSDKKVVAHLTPISKLKYLSPDDILSPHFLDELHKTGNQYFPVASNPKQSIPDIVGILELEDAVNSPLAKKVSDVMKKKVFYLHEDQTLKSALSVALKTQANAYIVVNSFEEIVGLIDAKLLISQLLGELEDEEAVDYSNLLSVAGLETKDNQPLANETEA